MKLLESPPPTTTVDQKLSTPPKLFYYPLPDPRPDPPGLSTPPINIPGSVPFRWEDAPGKPKRHLDHLLPPRHIPNSLPSKVLHLPPRMSPTTVLREPYPDGRLSYSLSFGEGRGGKKKERVRVLWRKLRKGRKSYDNSLSSVSPSAPPPSSSLSPTSSSSSWGTGSSDRYIDIYERGGGGWGGGGGGGGEEVDHGETRVTISRFRRSRSTSDIPSPAITHWLASIYGNLRKVIIPRRWGSFER